MSQQCDSSNSTSGHTSEAGNEVNATTVQRLRRGALTYYLDHTLRCCRPNSQHRIVHASAQQEMMQYSCKRSRLQQEAAITTVFTPPLWNFLKAPDYSWDNLATRSLRNCCEHFKLRAFQEAVVMKWSDYSLATQANLVRFLAGVLLDFRSGESCRTMPLVGGFSSRSPVLLPPCIPALLHAHLTSPSSAIKTSVLRAAQISSLHSTRLLSVLHQYELVTVVMQYTLQRLFLVKQYWMTNSVSETEKAYRCEFGVRKPSERNTIRALAGTLQTSGSLVSERGRRAHGCCGRQEQLQCYGLHITHHVSCDHREDYRRFHRTVAKRKGKGYFLLEVKIYKPMKPLRAECGEIWTAFNIEVLRADEGEVMCMEQRRNGRALGTGDPRKNLPISGIVQHDSLVRKSGSYPVGNRTRFAKVGVAYTPGFCRAWKLPGIQLSTIPRREGNGNSCGNFPLVAKNSRNVYAEAASAARTENKFYNATEQSSVQLLRKLAEYPLWYVLTLGALELDEVWRVGDRVYIYVLSFVEEWQRESRLSFSEARWPHRPVMFTVAS
ncbi:hypothetical protein PR048_010356 [Dryococelus australis]|uniref:DUF4817 domain-containing protein n=1 Tax=Dryococelus australis TaxID=614101 RepID=A0ABQ9I2L1_9NEOP|nr:hypothetical protein PR048_010356 [Dryococelus australis]